MAYVFDLMGWTPSPVPIDNPADSATLLLRLNVGSGDNTTAGWHFEDKTLRLGIVNDGNADRIVESRASFVFNGADWAACEAAAQTLQRIIALDAGEQARYFVGQRVMWFWKPDDGSKTLMTQVLGGNVEYSQDQFSMYDKAARLSVTVTFRHKNYFEDTEASRLPIYQLTDGVEITSTVLFWQATAGNSGANINVGIIVKAADIGGDLPAPLLANTQSNNGIYQGRHHIGVLPYTNFAQTDLTLEAESAVRDGTFASSGTVTTAPRPLNASGGATVQVTSLSTTYIKLFRWELASNQVIGTYPFRALAAFWYEDKPSGALNAYLRIRRGATDSTLVQDTPVFTIPSGAVGFDFGVINPTRPSADGVLYLELWAKAVTGTVNFELDCLQLLPAWSYWSVNFATTADDYVFYDTINYQQIAMNVADAYSDFATANTAGYTTETQGTYIQKMEIEQGAYLRQLRLTTFSKTGTPPASITVTVYTDNAGALGSVVSTATLNPVSVSTSPTTGTNTIQISPAIPLAAGTYWVEFSTTANASNYYRYRVGADLGFGAFYIGNTSTPDASGRAVNGGFQFEFDLSKDNLPNIGRGLYLYPGRDNVMMNYKIIDSASYLFGINSAFNLFYTRPRYQSF